ncbi:hypothetical protein V6N13_060344 [Hibiscus sabdariffa]|uniref:Uncharacterized protein n=2 Tax=Hibiscus sabdariffa TaxID=183260 RepID=A0ABR1ZP54_9ROSI
MRQIFPLVNMLQLPLWINNCRKVGVRPLRLVVFVVTKGVLESKRRGLQVNHRNESRITTKMLPSELMQHILARMNSEKSHTVGSNRSSPVNHISNGDEDFFNWFRPRYHGCM